jgi:hypothetical protein
MAPKCDVVFDKKFLYNNFDKKFITTEYKVHRENILFNREQVNFKDTLNEITRKHYISNIMDEDVITQYRIKVIPKFISIIYTFNKKYEGYRFKCPLLNCGRSITRSLYCNYCKIYIHEKFIQYGNSSERLNSELLQLNIANSKDIHNIRSLYDLQKIKYSENNASSDNQEFNVELLIPMYNLILNKILEILLREESRDLGHYSWEMNKLITNYRNNNSFIMICPNAQCNGYISSSMKCAICETIICKDCHEIKNKPTDVESAHICNQDIISSVNLISKDTKPCPKCFVPIYKSVGCDNMYCIKCKVFFKWESGKIINRIVHNPEHSDEMRATGSNYIPRDPNDILCGRELDHYFIETLYFKVAHGNREFDYCTEKHLHNKIRFRAGYSEPYVEFMHNAPLRPNAEQNIKILYKVICKIKQFRIEISRIPDMHNYLTKNANLTNLYLENIITKDTYKTGLQRNEKKFQKDEDVRNILKLFISCIIDLLYKLSDDVTKIDDIYAECDNLRIISNEYLENVYDIHFAQIYNITENYHLVERPKILFTKPSEF